MAMNRIQFQAGLSLPQFLAEYGTEAQCEAALERARWPKGFQCPVCGGSAHYPLQHRGRKAFQCRQCRHQTSLIAGTVFQATKLPLTVWFLSIYLLSQAKTGLSALALKRQLGISYPSAWLIHHKLMHTMTERDAHIRLGGDVQIDDAYLGGELRGGKAGRGSQNKTPFIAAVSLTEEGHPLYTKMIPVQAFSLISVANWASEHLLPDSRVVSDGLACFSAVTAAGCQHQPIVVAGRKPDQLPQMNWVNTALGNLKNTIRGAYHAFRFRKYSRRYLGAFDYRFNRRFDLALLPGRLINAAATTAPFPLRLARVAEVRC